MSSGGLGNKQVTAICMEGSLCYIDHRPLNSLDNAKMSNDRVMRWALTLRPFRYRIESIKGSLTLGRITSVVHPLSNVSLLVGCVVIFECV